MNKIRFTLNAITALLFLLAFASLAHAQATRTWVSGVGDDVNPCSRTAPCKTFAGAISKTAAGGEISVLDPGGFGAVTITKAITIDGSNGAGFGHILACGTSGIIVNAGANDVITLRNLTINGCRQTTSPGISGIRFLAGRTLHVQNLNIFGFNTNGIDVNLTADGRNVTVQDTTIREMGTAGVSVTTNTGTVAAELNNVQIDKCVTGVSAGTGSIITMRNSAASFNTNGVNTVNGSQVNIDNSLFAYNSTTGVNVVAGATARLNNNTFANNITGVANNGSAQSAANNKFMGNITDRSGAAFGAVGVQ